MSDAALSASAPAVSTAGPRDFLALLKPRVMSLVVFTGLVGLVAAPAAMHPVAAFTALLCIAVGAGASGALNMWYDADIDRIMARTASRPIPAGKVAPDEALVFGIVLAVFSVGVMGVLVNWLAAGLLAFTIWFYAHVYTMILKRRTAQNIVVGGLAGAMPPVIGWAAATNAVALEPLVMVLIIFLWTPPHFWALALYRSGDYARAGVPMLPVAAGDAETRRQIVLYTVLLVASTALPVLLGYSGVLYAIVAALGGLGFLHQAWKVSRSGELEPKAAAKVTLGAFAFSILYLFALFAAILVEDLAGLAPFAGLA